MEQHELGFQKDFNQVTLFYMINIDKDKFNLVKTFMTRGRSLLRNFLVMMLLDRPNQEGGWIGVQVSRTCFALQVNASLVTNFSDQKLLVTIVTNLDTNLQN